MVQTGFGRQAAAMTQLGVVDRAAIAGSDRDRPGGVQTVCQKVQKGYQPQGDSGIRGLAGSAEHPAYALISGLIVVTLCGAVAAAKTLSALFFFQMDVAVALMKKSVGVGPGPAGLNADDHKKSHRPNKTQSL